MMTCRDVSTAVAAGQVGRQRLATRLQIWMHLAICPPCRRFWQQVRALDRSVRSWLKAVEAEAPADLEARVTDRLMKAPDLQTASGVSPESRTPPR